jgi:Tfp pilus assembly protein FimT
MTGRRGLSRVELAAVLGVLAVALAMVPPAMLRWREAARQAQVQSHLKRLGAAIQSEQAMQPRYVETADAGRK